MAHARHATEPGSRALFHLDELPVAHMPDLRYSSLRVNQAGERLPDACNPSANVSATASAKSGERPSLRRMTSLLSSTMRPEESCRELKHVRSACSSSLSGSLKP